MQSLTDPKFENECGSVSPRTGRTCNHIKGHRGKCARIAQDEKKRWFVVEYWPHPDKFKEEYE